MDEKEIKTVETQQDDKKKARKKIWFYVLFVVVNAAVITAMILFEDRSGERISGKDAFLYLSENPWYTIAALSMYFVIVCADVVVFLCLTRALKIKFSFSSCLAVSLLGRYYDRITPWAMGGEPFQILYLKKKGLSTGDAGAVTMSRHIIRFFTVAVAVIAILASSGVVTNIYVMIAAIFSVFAGLVVPTFMLICAFKPKIGFKIGDGFIHLGYKLKIIKDKEKARGKMNKNVDDFLTGIKFLSVNKVMIAVIGAAALVEMFAYNSAPFFVLRALGTTDIRYWHTLVLCLFVNYASSFAPTPGGAGIAELSFYAIFAAYGNGGLIFWCVVFWRIAVFYIPVFIGFVMTVVGSIGNIVKLRRSVRG